MNSETTTEEQENAAYIEQLKPREKAAMRIAIRMTSFDLRKSNGFIQWKKAKGQSSKP
jgi:hypothetical protein